MAQLNDALRSRLWAEYNAGQMPVEIRMKYETWLKHTEDAEFWELVDLGDDHANYDGLTVRFDAWYVEPKILTKPIDAV